MATSVQNKRFGLQTKLLRWSGISLEEKESIWFNLYSCTILGAIFTAGMFNMIEIMTHTEHIDNVVGNLVFGGSLLMALVKISSVYILRKRIGKSIVLLDNDVFVPNIRRGGKKEENIINECMTYANAQGFLLVLISFLYSLRPNIETAILRISYSSNSSYWTLPFGEVSVLKNVQSPLYEMAWFYQSFANFIGCIGYSSTFVYIAAVMAFLSAQCRILQNSIKTSIKCKYPDTVECREVTNKGCNRHLENNWIFLQKILKEIVDYHMLITDISNEFENIFYIPTLFDFVGLSILLCLSLFYSTFVSEFNYLFLQMVCLSLGEIALQLMTAYWANELSLQYMAIGRACTEVEYVGSDLRFQKGLCLIIQRTQNPVHFTVGKFAPLSLNTFIMVMRAAYSCCMLLHNMDI